MKALDWFALTLMLSATTLLPAQEPPKPMSPTETPVPPVRINRADTQCVVDHLERSWGIKSLTGKATKTELTKEKNTTEIKFTLYFSKNLREPSDLAELLAAFAASEEQPEGDKLNGLALVFHLFDDENVSLGKFPVRGLEGELTGAKDDAFRVILNCPADKAAKALKVEARLLKYSPASTIKLRP